MGIAAVLYWVDKYKAKINGRFSSEFIKDALEIIMANNVYFFDDKHFKQLFGIAMGTKVATSYANLTIAYLEEYLFEKLMDSYDNVTVNTITSNWMRYRDDCIIKWNDEWGNIEEFHNLLNSLHPSIKVTMETSQHSLSFLDIKIFKTGNINKFDIFYKPIKCSIHSTSVLPPMTY